MGVDVIACPICGLGFYDCDWDAETFQFAGTEPLQICRVCSKLALANTEPDAVQLVPCFLKTEGESVKRYTNIIALHKERLGDIIAADPGLSSSYGCEGKYGQKIWFATFHKLHQHLTLHSPDEEYPIEDVVWKALPPLRDHIRKSVDARIKVLKEFVGVVCPPEPPSPPTTYGPRSGKAAKSRRRRANKRTQPKRKKARCV